MYMNVDNGYVNDDNNNMNSSTGSDINNQNYIDYTKKIYEIYTNRYLRENNGWPDGVDIDDMLPASTLNQHVNMEYNNEHYKLHSNGNSSKFNSLVSTLTSPYVTLKNAKWRSLLSSIHENIKYSYWSKTRSRAVRTASDAMKQHIKLLSNKIWHLVIPENLLKDNDMKEVVSEMGIFITLHIQEIISNNKCQWGFYKS